MCAGIAPIPSATEIARGDFMQTCQLHPGVLMISSDKVLAQASVKYPYLDTVA